ncbi:Fc.00g082960.m01.CDS01 [Cosmosporella sp. VM-42]
MAAAPSGKEAPTTEADSPLEALRIPEPYATYLHVRGIRAARRVLKAVGVWPWDIVPEAPPKQWAINLIEDMALVSEHVARNPDETLEDLRDELRRSMSRDRKPSYAGRLMAQDVQAAKKRFVRTRDDQVDDGSPGSKRQPVPRRRTIQISAPPTPSQTNHVTSTPDDHDDDDPSSITVASGSPPSPLVPRSVRALKRPATAMAGPVEKRLRAPSPDHSRLSAAQSLMLFSSPMASFHMTPSLRTSSTSSAARSLNNENLYESLQPATNAYLSALDTHVQSIRASLVCAQKEVFPHRAVHQEAMRRHRASEAKTRGIQEEIAESREKLRQLLEETAEQDALAPQLHALQENNMSLPPEIAEAIRSYDTRRAAKNNEVRKHEAVIEVKEAELEQARVELEAAEEETSRLEAGMQGLQQAVTHGTEAARLAQLFGVMVRLGPSGLASIERIYPEIGSLLEELLAVDGNSTETAEAQDGDGDHGDPILDPGLAQDS